MLRRIVLALGVALITIEIGGIASVASGDSSYRPAHNAGVDITVGSLAVNSVVINGAFTFSGSGFDPGEHVGVAVSFDQLSAVRLRSSPGALQRAAAQRVAAQRSVVVADANGSFSSQMAIEHGGTATVNATGLTSGKSASYTLPVFVTDAAGPQVSNRHGYGTAAGVGGDGAAVAGGADRAASGKVASGLVTTDKGLAGPIAVGAAALFAGLSLLFFGTRSARQHRSVNVAR